MGRKAARTLWMVPVAIPFLLATGLDWGQQAVFHDVEITVDAETGTISYSQDPVHAKRGDHIRWSCEAGNWAVHFIDKTPFAQGSLRGKRGGPKHLPVRPNAEIGEYKYFVAVSVGDEVFTDDPKIIIGP